MRDLLAATDPDAELAVDLFVRNAAMSIAAAATTLDTWSTLVFTGGVGEHADKLRDRICSRLRLAGVDVVVAHVDEARVMDAYTRDLLAP